MINVTSFPVLTGIIKGGGDLSMAPAVRERIIGIK